MNGVETNKMLLNILADYEGMGRKYPFEDRAIIDCLMKFYYTNNVIDWQEIKWLFMSYLQFGVLDFQTAEIMAYRRKRTEVTR